MAHAGVRGIVRRPGPTRCVACHFACYFAHLRAGPRRTRRSCTSWGTATRRDARRSRRAPRVVFRGVARIRKPLICALHRLGSDVLDPGSRQQPGRQRRGDRHDPRRAARTRPQRPRPRRVERFRLCAAEGTSRLPRAAAPDSLCSTLDRIPKARRSRRSADSSTTATISMAADPLLPPQTAVSTPRGMARRSTQSQARSTGASGSRGPTMTVRHSTTTRSRGRSPRGRVGVAECVCSPGPRAHW